MAVFSKLCAASFLYGSVHAANAPPPYPGQHQQPYYGQAYTPPPPPPGYAAYPPPPPPGYAAYPPPPPGAPAYAPQYQHPAQQQQHLSQQHYAGQQYQHGVPPVHHQQQQAYAAASGTVQQIQHAHAQRKGRHSSDQLFTVDMHAYNLQAPLPVEAVTGPEAEWTVSGSTAITMKDRVMVNPDVQNRWGLLWHRTPITSNHYQGMLKMKINGDIIKGQGVALWLVKENFAQTYGNGNFYGAFKKIERDTPPEQAEAEWAKLHAHWGIDFYGYRKDFQGLGVLFRETESGMPAVECLDSSKSLTGRGQSPNMSPPTPMRVTNENLTIQWHRKPNGLITFTLQTDSMIQAKLEPKQLCEFQTGTYLGSEATPVDQHFGITAYSGQTADGRARSAEVSVYAVQMVNHDEHHASRLMSVDGHYGDSGKKSAAERDLEEIMKGDMFSSSPATALGDGAMKQHVEQLTDALQRHITRMSDRGIVREIEAVNERAAALHNQVAKLKNEVRVVLGGESNTSAEGGGGLGELRSQLQNVKTILQTKDREAGRLVEMTHMAASSSGLESVSDRLAQSTLHLEDAMTGSTHTFRLLMLIVGTFSGVLLVISRKMRSYEKKHFL